VFELVDSAFEVVEAPQQVEDHGVQLRLVDHG
jgi:hypothetical protein